MTIPANIDYVGIVGDLNRWGITDYKIELMCGFAKFYIGHLKQCRYRDMSYQRAARLYNLWCEEASAHGISIPWAPSLTGQPVNCRQLVGTT